MRPGTALQEYKTICEFMRLYATLRFYQLALLLGTTGAIVTALLTSTTIHASLALATTLKIGGVAVAAALTVMEFRASSYWHHMRDRANILCVALGYEPFPASSRWSPLTTSGAGFYLHVLITALWVTSLFIRFVPPT